jgi:uncharacterized protein (TIGR00730 family)
MAEIRSICVYCGSSAGKDPIHLATARRLGELLARERIRLIYGGGGIGLMGALAHAAMEAGGEVTGVIPEFLVERERAFEGAREVIVTRDMHERKRIMFERADAFAVLPGGIGTLEELVEQLSWLQLEQHRKPIALVNVNGYWDPFFALLDHMRAQRFLHTVRTLCIEAARVEDVVPKLRAAAKAVPDETLRDGKAREVAQKM